MISLQAPPNREQVCGSHPIQFAVPILADDREVFTRRLYLGRRKPKLSFAKPDEIGNSDRSILQFIEDVAANPNAIGNTTHDAALLCCALRRRRLPLAGYERNGSRRSPLLPRSLKSFGYS